MATPTKTTSKPVEEKSATDYKFINFMGIRKWTNGFSIILSILCVISIATHGFKLGLDFTGGTQLQISLNHPADIPTIRKVLEEEHLRAPSAVIFGADTEVMIRTQDSMKEKGRQQINAKLAAIGTDIAVKEVQPPSREQSGYNSVLVISNASVEQIQQSNVFDAANFGKVEIIANGKDVKVAVEQSLEGVYIKELLHKISEAAHSEIKLQSSADVGPQIGEELFNKGAIGMLAAFALVFFYVAIQFQWKFSVGAIVSLVHDTVVTLGLFSFFQWEFDLTVLAAVLALIGYSINDTIVVFDRVRENFRKLRKTDAVTVVNISMTQTLERSIMTHVTVFLVVLVLYIFGGELLAGFSKAMLVGVVFGTYSSIYIAANTAVALGVSKEDLMPPTKEGEDTTP